MLDKSQTDNVIVEYKVNLACYNSVYDWKFKAGNQFYSNSYYLDHKQHEIGQYTPLLPG